MLQKTTTRKTAASSRTGGPTGSAPAWGWHRAEGWRLPAPLPRLGPRVPRRSLRGARETIVAAATGPRARAQPRSLPSSTGAGARRRPRLVRRCDWLVAPWGGAIQPPPPFARARPGQSVFVRGSARGTGRCVLAARRTALSPSCRGGLLRSLSGTPMRRVGAWEAVARPGPGQGEGRGALCDVCRGAGACRFFSEFCPGLEGESRSLP